MGNKGDGVLEQAVQDAQQAEAAAAASGAPAQPTPAPCEVPATWTETLSLKWLDVVFPAVPIEIAETAAMPVYEMEAFAFSERAQVWQNARGYFLAGATGMREYRLTKADYAGQMESILRGYYDQEAGAYIPYDERPCRNGWRSSGANTPLRRRKSRSGRFYSRACKRRSRWSLRYRRGRRGQASLTTGS